jgi:hypothetical protein
LATDVSSNGCRGLLGPKQQTLGAELDNRNKTSFASSFPIWHKACHP